MTLETYVFDIDGTICNEPCHDVLNRTPYPDRIAQINKLAKEGHTIVIYTSRGMKSTNGDPIASDIKYRKITETQLAEWGVHYDKLYFGKPAGTVYVDNYNQTIKQFFVNCDLSSDSGY